MRRFIVLMLGAAMALAGVLVPQPAAAQVDVYTTPGTHTVNGRQWRTTCAKYSSVVERCTTEIWASTVSFDGRKYVEKQGWAFNNLTYKRSPRAAWKEMDPLVTPGRHKINGREWRTQCDTAWTGANGCRSEIMATVIEKGTNGYRTVNKFVFNNVVHVIPVPCVVSQAQLRKDVKIEETVLHGCTRSHTNSTWVAVDFPVALADNSRYMSTAFFRMSGDSWRFAGRSSGNMLICQWVRDNNTPQDLVDKHLPYCG